MHREIAKGKSLSAEEEYVYASVVYIPKTRGADLRKSHLFHPINSSAKCRSHIMYCIGVRGT